MYSIGEFSKINRITTKTLRHYDKIGLLKPEKIDSWTGYRFYSNNQLSRIKQILNYKELGFSLDLIILLMNEKTSKEVLLQRRLLEIKVEIKKSKEQLKKVLFILDNPEEGEETMKDIIVKSLPEVLVASMRVVIKNYDTYFDVVPKMGEYMNKVGAVCLEPAYCFTIYHDGEYKEENIDVEVCEAVVKPCKESETIKFKTIKGYSKAATIIHVGDYNSIRESYNLIFSWIESNGYKILDNPRESYIDGIWNKEDPSEWTTEIQIPIN